MTVAPVESGILTGIPEESRPLADAALGNVIPSLESGSFCLVGGIVTRYYLSQQGVTNGRAFRDIDIATVHPDAILPPLYDQLAITHFHPPEADRYGRHFISGIDRDTGMKVDLLTWPTHVLPEPPHAIWGETKLPITTLEVEAMFKIWNAAHNLPTGVYAKTLQDLDLLMEFADIAEIERLWRLYSPAKTGQALGSLAIVRAAIESIPELLVTPKSPPFITRGCQNCMSSFSLASQAEINDLAKRTKTMGDSMALDYGTIRL